MIIPTKEVRFEFGKNWNKFLKVIDEMRIIEAENSLKQMLDIDNLESKSFLDIGCGSGLFSLAARRLGAKVYSFDYDRQSVACTLKLKDRYFPNDFNWKIQQGSVLDNDYLRSLGQFDIVYAWGVLHHTGAMWQAMENVCSLVKVGGRLFIAIYNDQGIRSKVWWRVKKFYCSGTINKILVTSFFIPCFIIKGIIVDFAKLKNPIKRYTEYKKSRGMSIVYDWFDWLGGFPYEFAKPQDIINFYKLRGFVLQKIKIHGRSGNNEFVFERK